MLSTASYYDHTGLTEDFIQYGIDVNVRKLDGPTPLRHACLGVLDGASKEWEYGRTYDNSSELLLLLRKRVPTIRLLLAAGASMYHSNNRGSTYLVCGEIGQCSSVTVVKMVLHAAIQMCELSQEYVEKLTGKNLRDLSKFEGVWMKPLLLLRFCESLHRVRNSFDDDHSDYC